MTEQLLDTILTKLLNIEEKIDDVVTKEELSIAKSEILGDVDRFVKLHETLDHE